jgi:hypothetical protein
MSLNKLIGYRGKRLRIEDSRNFSRCDRFFSHDNSFLSAQCKEGPHDRSTWRDQRRRLSPVAVKERTDDCRRYHLGDRDPGQHVRPSEALA